MNVPTLNDPRLEQMRGKDGQYYLPNSPYPRSREDARDLLELNDWMGREIPDDRATTAMFLRLIHEIEALKERMAS